MSKIAAWLEQHQISPTAVVMTLAVVIAAAIGILMFSRLLQRWLSYLQKRFNWADEITHITSRIVTIGLWVLTALFIFSLWGVGVGGVWTLLVSVLTIIGVAFLATWAMISNFTASFFLTLWRPFHSGQRVEILPESLMGRVVGRNLMFTLLREENGNVLNVPNNIFFQKIFRVIGEPVPSMDPPEERGPAVTSVPAEPQQ